MNIFLCVLSVIFLFGMFGDNDAGNRKMYAWCFNITIIATIALKALTVF